MDSHRVGVPTLLLAAVGCPERKPCIAPAGEDGGSKIKVRDRMRRELGSVLALNETIERDHQ